MVATTFTKATLTDRPAHISDYGDIPDSILNGLFRVEPDFFDRGREQFEREIERLIRMDTNIVKLTVDDSIQFDPEVLEKIRG